MKTLRDPLDLSRPPVKNMADPLKLIGFNAVDCRGRKIGTIGEVYLDDQTGSPEWATLRLGHGRKHVFVPLTTCETRRGNLLLPYDRSLIEAAPSIAAGAHLSPAEEMRLYRHYRGQAEPAGPPSDSVADDRAADDSGSSHSPAVIPAPAGHPAQGQVPSTDPAGSVDGTTCAQKTEKGGTALPPGPAPACETGQPHPVQTPVADMLDDVPASSRGDRAQHPGKPVEFTCHAEKLDISTEWHTLGKISVRRFVVGEAVQEVVPLVRERVKVERFPIAAAEAPWATGQEDLSKMSDALEEVTFREERAVVRKRLVPVERIRLTIEQDTVPYTVNDEVRKEQLEIRDTRAEAAGEAEHVPQP